MQGASPLASPGLNPGGTGKGGKPRARRGFVPVGCQLTLPLWCPAGACPLCHLPPLPFRHPQGGLPFSSPAYPAFSFISAPYPPTPFPGGEGGALRLFYARGFAPCIPGAEPARHLLSLPLWKTQWGLAPAALAVPAPGERTISNAEVPLPRSPLSLAAGTAHREPLPVGFAANHGLPSAQGICLAGSVSAASGLMPGCRGRSPRRNKVIVSPFPAGEGGRGDRGQKQS